ADRGGPRRHDAFRQAWWQDLGPHFSGQADHEEAAGDAYGQGQGRPRAVGGRRQAGARALRDGRRDRNRSARSLEAGRCQAADPHQVLDALRAGESAMKAAELRGLGADELATKERELTDQLFRMRIQKSMGTLERPENMRTIRRDLA